MEHNKIWILICNIIELKLKPALLNWWQMNIYDYLAKDMQPDSSKLSLLWKVKEKPVSWLYFLYVQQTQSPGRLKAQLERWCK